MIKRYITFFSLILFLNAEPSAFELQSGATKNDISNLQLSSRNLQGIATDLQNRLKNTEQIQEGLKTLLEGQNFKIKKIDDSFIILQNGFNGLQNQFESANERAKEQNQDIEVLKAQLLAQQEEIKKIQYSIQEINKVMTENNNSIIQQLTLMSQFLEKTQNNLPALSEEKNESKKEENQIPKTSKQKFSDAKSFVRKKEFNSAEEILNELIQEKYKVAECYYILGDIAYRKKEYKSALDLYKKSATLDENASYMPTLLWRTAWSFKYLKDEKNYQNFIALLARTHPDSEQGKKAIDIVNKSNSKEKEN